MREVNEQTKSRSFYVAENNRSSLTMHTGPVMAGAWWLREGRQGAGRQQGGREGEQAEEEKKPQE